VVYYFARILPVFAVFNLLTDDARFDDVRRSQFMSAAAGRFPGHAADNFMTRNDDTARAKYGKLKQRVSINASINQSIIQLVLVQM